MRPEQFDGMKLQGQRSLIQKDGPPTVRNEGDCQHQGGREPGLVVRLTHVNCS